MNTKKYKSAIFTAKTVKCTICFSVFVLICTFVYSDTYDAATRRRAQFLLDELNALEKKSEKLVNPKEEKFCEGMTNEAITRCRDSADKKKEKSINEAFEKFIDTVPEMKIGNKTYSREIILQGSKMIIKDNSPPGRYEQKSTTTMSYKYEIDVDIKIEISDALKQELEAIANQEIPLYMEQKITGMEFVLVKGGCFDMGSDKEGGVIPDICVDSFYMGKYEVSNVQFIKFRPDHYSRKHQAYSPEKEIFPVTDVSWNDAVEFASWLSKKTGERFRLPTEAEWEYAARAGSKTSRFWGDKPEEACQYANIRDCSKDFSPVRVGKFSANSFGLYDMLGNVWEWVEDIYEGDKNRYGSNKKNPRYITGTTDSLHVLRGGSSSEFAKKVDCAYRNPAMPTAGLPDAGFRLVREKQ